MWCPLVPTEKCKKKKSLRLSSPDLHCKLIRHTLTRWSKAVGSLDCVCSYFQWYFMAVVNLLCRVDKNSERVILTPAKITGKKRNIHSCLYRASPDRLVASYTWLRNLLPGCISIPFFKKQISSDDDRLTF